MDAASKFKTFVVALAVTLGTVSLAHSDDADTKSACQDKPCPDKSCQDKSCQTTVTGSSACTVGACCDGKVCEAGKCIAEKCELIAVAKSESANQSSSSQGDIVSLVSEWLAKSPKFSADFAIHFGSPNTLQASGKLPIGVNFPVDVQLQDGQSGRFSVGAIVNSDFGVAGNLILDERKFDITRFVFNSSGNISRAPHLARPMRFTDRLPRLQLGDLVSDVIICGHRICSGTKCYDVQDEPMAGTACDKSEEVETSDSADEEQILVLPMAPPAPPGLEIAYNGNVFEQSEAASVLRSSGLENVKISVPVTTVVDLLVAKTELSTRLEMTSMIMEEREIAMEQIQSLANRNATLATQLAVAEARNQMTDALTAGIIERAELAIKLASVDPKAKLLGSGNVVQTIQEDLSNIRRQIALLRRTAPVPFAQSYVGKQSTQPYIPTAQLPVEQMIKDGEATCAGDACPSGKSIK